MKNVIFVIVFLLIAGRPYSQELVVLDSLYGGGVSELIISSNGDRYYSFNDLKDSISFNDFSTILPKERKVNGLRSYSSTQYIFAFSENGQYQFHKQGMTGVTISGSELLSRSGFIQDTLYTTDNFFVNASSDYGSNQVLHVFDLNGSFIDYKHWESIEGHYGFVIIEEYEDRYLVTGYLQYYRHDSVYIDDISVPFHGGEYEGFFGWMSKDDYTLEEIFLKTEGGYGFQFFSYFVLEDDRLVATGVTTSSFVYVCNDTIENRAQTVWGSDGVFLLASDYEGNCLMHNSPYYDGGSMGTSYFGAFPNGEYLWHGSYGGVYVDWNGVRVERAFRIAKSCLFVFDHNLQATRAWQIETSYGTAAIHDSQIDKDGNIWIVGWTEDNELSFGSYDMVLDPQYSRLSFIAKLDPYFNVLWAENLGALSLGGFIYGEDDNIYARGTPFVDTLRYSKISYTFRLDDPFVSNEEEEIIDKSLLVYPNPASDILNINEEDHMQYQIYDFTGRIVISGQGDDSINISHLSQGVYIISIRQKSNEELRTKFIKI